MSMKEKKKVYVKPTITVAEWDFNEAVCDDNVMILSRCINVRVNGNGGVAAIETRGDYSEDSELNWSKWPSSNN